MLYFLVFYVFLGPQRKISCSTTHRGKSQKLPFLPWGTEHNESSTWWYQGGGLLSTLAFLFWEGLGATTAERRPREAAAAMMSASSSVSCVSSSGGAWTCNTQTDRSQTSLYYNCAYIYWTIPKPREALEMFGNFKIALRLLDLVIYNGFAKTNLSQQICWGWDWNFQHCV